MNGAEGDLVVIHFIVPREAVHFVARLASLPFRDSQVEVNAVKAIDPYHRWARTAAFLHIEPIPIKQIQEAQNGFLVLKVRSGKYLHPECEGRLKIGPLLPPGVNTQVCCSRWPTSSKSGGRCAAATPGQAPPWLSHTLPGEDAGGRVRAVVRPHPPPCLHGSPVG